MHQITGPPTSATSLVETNNTLGTDLLGSAAAS